MATKQSLLQLLSDNQMDRLFEELNGSPNRNGDLVLLESQWRDLQTRQRTGVISGEQANLEAARIRKGLLELIDLSFAKGPAAPAPLVTTPNRLMPMNVLQWGGISLAVFLILLLIAYSPAWSGNEKIRSSAPGDQAKPTAAVEKKSLKKGAQLDVSAASPITLAAGDFQYERQYKVIEGRVEDLGGGQRLVTLKVGLDFRGIINHLLDNGDFRLVADGLNGPLAPSNHISVLIDAKSYGEGEVKFELSEAITRFSVILEDKPTKRWDFTIQ